VKQATITIAGILVLVYVAIHLDWKDANTDFAAFYSAAKVGPVRYLNHADMQIANAELGSIDLARSYLPRLPFFVAMMKPLSLLSYTAALNLWRVLMAATLVASSAIWVRWHCSAHVVLAWSLPALWAIFAGQDVSLCFLAASASLVIANPFLAGVILGFASLKWHLFVFIAAVLIARREWLIIAGSAISVATVIAGSFALCPNWLPRMVDMLRNAAMHPNFNRSPGIRTLFVASPIAFVAVLAISAVLVGLISTRLPRNVCFALAMAAGCIVNAHSYAHDCILLIPLIAIAIGTNGSLKRIGIALASPIPYLALLFGVAWPVRLGVVAIATMLFGRVMTLAPWTHCQCADGELP